MPQYEFGMPKIQEILDALERSKSQSQQERPTATETVNDATLQGLSNANNPAPPPQQPLQQPLSQLDVALANQIIGAKGNYDNADILAKAQAPQGADEAAIKAIADSIRNSAHGDAENTRRLAAAAGVDLSPYDANVTAQDARFNLQSRQVKDIADLMSGQGRYARTADQFFNDEYLMLGSEGYSAREAKRIAGQRAQEYQADRVTYLRNAFNVHGLDGNYINGTGVDILNEMATEMPTVANVYAQAYQLPTQLQDRFNALRDKEIAQANALELADVNNGYALGRIDRTGQWNFHLQQNAAKNTIERDKLQHEQDMDKLTYEWGKRWELWTNQRDYEEKIADAKWQKNLDRGIALAQALGYKGDDFRTFVAASVGINFVRGKDGKSQPKDEKSVENLKKIHDMVSKQIDTIDKALESLDISNEERRTLSARRQMCVDYLSDLQTAAGDVVFGGKDDGGVAALTGDLEKDAPTLDALWEDTGHDPEKFKNAVKYVLYQGGTKTVSGVLYEQRIMEKYTRK